MKNTRAASRADGNRLSPAFYPFLAMISCFSMVQLVHNTFLSTYTLAATGSTQNVQIFNILLAACQPVAMVAAVAMVRRVSALRAQQLGLLLIVLINVYLFVAVDRAAEHIFAVSVVQSTANGFYFTTYACQFVSYTANENRDRASGLANLVTNVLSLLFSLGSSVLFGVYPGGAGYRILFLVAFAVSVAALALSFRLEPLRGEESGCTMYYLYAHRVFWRNRWACASLLVSTLDGMRAGVMAFFLNVLLYSMVDSEALVGVNTLITTLCSIVAFAIYARAVGVHRRYRSAQWSIFAMLLATLGLMAWMDPVSIMAYSAINAFMLPFYSTPLLNVYWTVLEKLPELEKCRAETHAAREVYYGLGRVAGVALTMLLPATGVGAAMALLCLMGAQYLGLYLSRGVMRDLDQIPL